MLLISYVFYFACHARMCCRRVSLSVYATKEEGDWDQLAREICAYLPLHALSLQSGGLFPWRLSLAEEDCLSLLLLSFPGVFADVSPVSFLFSLLMLQLVRRHSKQEPSAWQTDPTTEKATTSGCRSAANNRPWCGRCDALGRSWSCNGPACWVAFK